MGEWNLMDQYIFYRYPHKVNWLSNRPSGGEGQESGGAQTIQSLMRHYALVKVVIIAAVLPWISFQLS